jgi:ribonuclease P protein component
MLGRTHRFHGYNSLKRAYQHGQTSRSSLINLRCAPRTGDRPYRVAIVVSRKVSKSAVVRNRIRRRIYEVVRQAPAVPPSTDLVFTVFSDQVASLEATQLTATIHELLQKAAASQKPPENIGQTSQTVL